MRVLPEADPGRPPLTSPGAYLRWQAHRQGGVLVGAIVCGIAGGAAQAALPFLLGRAVDGALPTASRLPSCTGAS